MEIKSPTTDNQLLQDKKLEQLYGLASELPAHPWQSTQDYFALTEKESSELDTKNTLLNRHPFNTVQKMKNFSKYVLGQPNKNI